MFVSTLLGAMGCVPDDAPVGPQPALVCVADPDNTLRFTCEAHTWGPADAVVVVDGAAYALTTGDDGRATFPLWGLPAGVDADVVIRHDGRATGVTVRPELPPELEPVRVDVTDDGGLVSLVAVPMQCGDASVLVFDRAGRVVWYADLSAYGRTIVAINPTDDGVVVGLDRERAVQLRFDGTVARDVVVAGDGTFLHHEILVVDDLMWVLTAEDWVDPSGHVWIADGLEAYDATGARTVDWDLSEAIDLARGDRSAGPRYWAGRLEGSETLHTNAAFVDDDDSWFLSLKYPSALLRLDARSDGAPGEVRWWMAGDGSGDIVPDAPFAQQHHVRRRYNGHIAVFDNESGATSRAVEYAVDEASGRATLTAEYVLPETCAVAGSYGRVADTQRVLLTCGDRNRVYEVGAQGDVTWEAALSCDLTDSLYATVRAFEVPNLGHTSLAPYDGQVR